MEGERGYRLKETQGEDESIEGGDEGGVQIQEEAAQVIRTRHFSTRELVSHIIDNPRQFWDRFFPSVGRLFLNSHSALLRQIQNASRI